MEVSDAQSRLGRPVVSPAWLASASRVGSSGTFDGIESSSAGWLRTGGCSWPLDLVAGLAATVDRAGSEDAGKSLTIGVPTASPQHRVEVVLAYKACITAPSTIADDLNVVGSSSLGAK